MQAAQELAARSLERLKLGVTAFGCADANNTLWFHGLCVFHVFPFRLHGLKEFLVFGLGLVARRQQRAAPTAQAEIRQMFQLSNLIKGSFDKQTS